MRLSYRDVSGRCFDVVVDAEETQTRGVKIVHVPSPYISRAPSTAGQQVPANRVPVRMIVCAGA